MLAGLAKLVTVVLLASSTSGAPVLNANAAAEVDRLEGHDVRIDGPGNYTILDIAGDGPPLVGCIRQSPRGLELVSEGDRHLLVGPLAAPRIAGPNYKVWVVGQAGSSGELQAKRLGILAGPAACSADADR